MKKKPHYFCHNLSLKLQKVTLLGIDCVDAIRIANAIKKSISEIDFGCVKLLTSLNVISDDIEIVKIHEIRSKVEYSNFVINRLHEYVDTEYVLIIQWDGYVCNPNAWSNDFYKYDYIGAPWWWDKVVGNGGFSLRSKKLLNAVSQLKIVNYHPEDDIICRVNRNILIDMGIKFAPTEVAHRFSVENELYTKQFGWHGGTCPV